MIRFGSEVWRAKLKRGKPAHERRRTNWRCGSCRSTNSFKRASILSTRFMVNSLQKEGEVLMGPPSNSTPAASIRHMSAGNASHLSRPKAQKISHLERLRERPYEKLFWIRRSTKVTSVSVGSIAVPLSKYHEWRTRSGQCWFRSRKSAIAKRSGQLDRLVELQIY